jgi:hypothetical protein
MGRKLDADILAWALDLIGFARRSGFSGINAVERILRDPGISTGGSDHKILWFPRNRRISKISKAMHQIDRIDQICLIVESGALMDDDNRIFTMKDLARNSTLTVGSARDRAKKAKRKLNFIISNPVAH